MGVAILKAEEACGKVRDGKAWGTHRAQRLTHSYSETAVSCQYSVLLELEN